MFHTISHNCICWNKPLQAAVHISQSLYQPCSADRHLSSSSKAHPTCSVSPFTCHKTHLSARNRDVILMTQSQSVSVCTVHYCANQFFHHLSHNFRRANTQMGMDNTSLKRTENKTKRGNQITVAPFQLVSSIR